MRKKKSGKAFVTSISMTNSRVKGPSQRNSAYRIYDFHLRPNDPLVACAAHDLDDDLTNESKHGGVTLFPGPQTAAEQYRKLPPVSSSAASREKKPEPGK